MGSIIRAEPSIRQGETSGGRKTRDNGPPTPPLLPLPECTLLAIDRKAFQHATLPLSFPNLRWRSRTTMLCGMPCIPQLGKSWGVPACHVVAQFPRKWWEGSRKGCIVAGVQEAAIPVLPLVAKRE